ncbi:hypothetical protein D3C80_1105660 [compost metagenome]
MVEAVANHFLVAGIGVVFRAFVEISRETFAVWQRIDGPLFRQPAVVAGFRLVLEIRQERKVGFVTRTPAK